MESLGLYIHIPFCKSKCHYCDFASFTGCEEQISIYIDALLTELKQYEGMPVSTIFIGGGTPSLLPAKEFTRLMDGVCSSINLLSNSECSIEANPNSFDEEKAFAYKKAGISRISFGLQSSVPRLLQLIGRTHTKEDFSTAVTIANKAEITNINADMMYSLPTQTIDDIKETLEFLLLHPLSHISAYALKLEPNTPLYKNHPPLPDEDADREMFSLIKTTLQEKGFSRYEISNFSKPGKECKHNLKYWQMEPYIGIGVSAHSCYQNKRFWNASTLKDYLKGGVHIAEEPVDYLAEKLMLGLRLTNGIDHSLLPTNSQKLLEFYELLYSHDLAKQKDRQFFLTDHGLDIQNEILAKLFSLMS